MTKIFAAILAIFITQAAVAAPHYLEGQVWKDKAGAAVIFGCKKAFIQFPKEVGAFFYAGSYKYDGNIVTLQNMKFVGHDYPDMKLEFLSDDCLNVSFNETVICFERDRFFQGSKADAIEYKDQSLAAYLELLKELGL